MSKYQVEQGTSTLVTAVETGISFLVHKIGFPQAPTLGNMRNSLNGRTSAGIGKIHTFISLNSLRFSYNTPAKLNVGGSTPPFRTSYRAR